LNCNLPTEKIHSWLCNWRPFTPPNFGKQATRDDEEILFKSEFTHHHHCSSSLHINSISSLVVVLLLQLLLLSVGMSDNLLVDTSFDLSLPSCSSVPEVPPLVNDTDSDTNPKPDDFFLPDVSKKNNHASDLGDLMSFSPVPKPHKPTA